MPDLPSRVFPDGYQDGMQRAGFLCLAGSVSLVLVSIAASQILLAGAFAILLGERANREGPAVRSFPLVWPVVALGLWTTLAAILSSDVLLNLAKLKKFLLFTVVFLVPAIASKQGARAWIYRAIFGIGGISATAGLVQFALDPQRDALHRIKGFMSHWMTFSGTLMLVLIGLAAYLLSYGLRRAWWVVPLGVAVAASLDLAQTRSALLLGATAGLLAVTLVHRHFRMVAVIVALIAALYVLSPAVIQYRLKAAFDPNDPNTRNRIELFGTAARLIRDHPWFGVGPQGVPQAALKYRGDNSYPAWMYQHMHNNLLQIAAERGIPGLLLWCWLMAAIGWDAWRHLRAAQRAGPPSEAVREARMVSTAAVGAWLAVMAAGLFEYNFGDSEVLILFLFMVAAPYADDLAPAAAAARPAGG
jgi:putative inorganic carbon (HCO3(-)) transporter